MHAYLFRLKSSCHRKLQNPIKNFSRCARNSPASCWNPFLGKSIPCMPLLAVYYFEKIWMTGRTKTIFPQRFWSKSIEHLVYWSKVLVQHNLKVAGPWFKFKCIYQPRCYALVLEILSIYMYWTISAHDFTIQFWEVFVNNIKLFSNYPATNRRKQDFVKKIIYNNIKHFSNSRILYVT